MTDDFIFCCLIHRTIRVFAGKLPLGGSNLIPDYLSASISSIICGTMDNIILDTNVLVSALRSNRGASFKLLSLVGTGRFDISLSVPLVLEYEDVLTRQSGITIALSGTEIGDVLDYLCSVARHFRVYYLWRPILRDPHDDMVRELAVRAECPFIVTYNRSDFVGVEQLGIKAITPKALLERIGALP